jgi:hypothetical protein
MTEEERVKYINDKAAVCLEECLKKVEDGEANAENDFLASLYGHMVTAHVLGYNVEAMLRDAQAGGDNLLKLFEESELSVDI